MEFPGDDCHYEDTMAKTAEPAEGGGWYMGLATGCSFFCPADSPVEPKPGMPVRLYGKGVGYTVRGLFLDGRRVFYRTEAGQREKDRAEAEARERERRYDFERNRADYDRRDAALPEPFRRRLAAFRRGNPDFRWEYEPYELFVCEEAAKIAAALKTPEAVEAFRSLPWEEQAKAAPVSDGHSGNTFGCACVLASLYLSDPDRVAAVPGAIEPLVGSASFRGEAN